MCPSRRFPWWTLVLAGFACLVHTSPGFTAAAELSRAALGGGEFWRLFTAHFAHYGSDHLVWDVAALLILGVMAEPNNRRVFVGVLVASAFAIGVGVWAWQPQLTSYRGLSGLDSALFGLVCARLVADGWRERHAFSIALGALALIGFALKCGAELTSGATVFAVNNTAGYVPVPLAHAIGLAVGVLGAGFGRQENPRSRIGSQAGVNAVADVVIVEPFGVAGDALEMKAAAFGHGRAGTVAFRAGDDLAVQIAFGEAVGGERSHAAAHDAPALRVGRQPVADVGAAIGGVDAVVAAHADDDGLLENSAVQAGAGSGVRTREVDETSGRGGHARLVEPGQPAAQMVAVRVSQGEKLLGVVGLEGNQAETGIDGNRDHGEGDGVRLKKLFRNEKHKARTADNK
jgi:rhomboid family GlyGly-CTERM serine protease